MGGVPGPLAALSPSAHGSAARLRAAAGFGRLVARLVTLPLLLILVAIRPLVWIMDRVANVLSRGLGLGPIRIEETPAGVSSQDYCPQKHEYGY